MMESRMLMPASAFEGYHPKQWNHVPGIHVFLYACIRLPRVVPKARNRVFFLYACIRLRRVVPKIRNRVFFYMPASIRPRRVETARAHTSRWRGSAAATLLDVDMSKATSRPSSLFGEYVSRPGDKLLEIRLGCFYSWN